MRAPLTQADLHSEHPGLADVIANISSKTAAVQDEYLRGADMTFTTSSTLADLLELHRSGSAFFTAEQNTCLSENIARVKGAAGCEDGDAQLQAPVSPYKDLAAAAAVEVTHGNLKQYAAGVAETLCWTHSLAALNSMREGYAPPPHRLLLPAASSLPSPPAPSCRFELCMPPTELRHMLADDALAALFVPDIDVCEWRRRTVQHAANVQGGGQKPQFGWFWSYVEQCSQADRAEVSAPPRAHAPLHLCVRRISRWPARSSCRGGRACCHCRRAVCLASTTCTCRYPDLTLRALPPAPSFSSPLTPRPPSPVGLSLAAPAAATWSCRPMSPASSSSQSCA